jgi:hypothetical protein
MGLMKPEEYRLSVQKMKVNAYLNGKKVENLLESPVTGPWWKPRPSYTNWPLNPSMKFLKPSRWARNRSSARIGPKPPSNPRRGLYQIANPGERENR